MVHTGDLHAAEAGVGDLVDLASDLVRLDEAVRPPPAEPGAHGPRGAGEPIGGRPLFVTGGQCGRGGRHGAEGGHRPHGHSGGEDRAA
ncbi:hypothetical protein ABT052_08600 [Streptomyces sp. NPDC002766]|uniref:hypothetical protein n=1 Tax=Streptomyces sp. NPDC002766 TaxID=3154429 RepID=UPI003333EF1E